MSDVLRWIAVALSVAASCWWPRAVPAAQDSIVGPNGGVVAINSADLRRRGLTATIQIGRQVSPGYYAVRIVATGIGAAPADRRLTFRIATDPAGESPPANGLVIDLPMTVAQGARTTTVTRYVPKWSLGQSVEVSIWDNGSLLEDSRTHIGSMRTLPPLQSSVNIVGFSGAINLSSAGFARECRQDWLLIDESGEQSSELASRLREVLTQSSADTDPGNSPDEISGDDGSSGTFFQTDLTALPTDWRGYQSYDVVVMKSSTLKQCAANPSSLDPFRNWILQGGTVIVVQAESIQKTLDQLRFGPSRWSPDDQTLSSLDSQYTSRFDIVRDNTATLLKQLQPTIDHGNPTDQTGLTAQRDDAGPIRVQPVGAGLVFSIPAIDGGGDDGGIPPAQQWQQLKQQLVSRSSIMLRQGAEPLRGNRRFNQWTVPDVRQPPVYSFIGLLTVFVILVGPVAYIQTSKHGRSHLMFAIAPVLAIFTTLAMLGYGIVSDGFRTKVRMRQLTWVDGKSGDAGERVLATYFAGIRPGDGLKFPARAAVMRQAESDGMTWEEVNSLPPANLGRVIVRDDAQIFGSSFLPSRDQRQFIFHAPRTKLGSVHLLPPIGGANGPALKNGLQFPLRIVIARDSEGVYWGISSLRAGGVKPCVRLETKRASSWLARLYNNHRPMALTASDGRGARQDTQIIDPLRAIGRELGLQTQIEEGLFENWLSSNLQLINRLPEGHFIATADISDDVVAVAGSDVVDSVRYVFGTLP